MHQNAVQQNQVFKPRSVDIGQDLLLDNQPTDKKTLLLFTLFLLSMSTL